MAKRTVVAALVAFVFALMPSGAATELSEPEGCQAFNPGQPQCKYTATHNPEGPVTGVAGVGSWVVTVKRAGEAKPLVIKSPPGGEPTATEFVFEEGDKVTAKALSPGTGLTVGHVF